MFNRPIRIIMFSDSHANLCDMGPALDFKGTMSGKLKLTDSLGGIIRNAWKRNWKNQKDEITRRVLVKETSVTADLYERIFKTSGIIITRRGSREKFAQWNRRKLQRFLKKTKNPT